MNLEAYFDRLQKLANPDKRRKPVIKKPESTGPPPLPRP